MAGFGVGGRAPGRKPLKALFVHERFGAWAGAEANAFLTAAELKRRGHTVGLLHGAPTGRGESSWQEVFTSRFFLDGNPPRAAVRAAVGEFGPDLLYVHKMANLEVLEAVADSGVPVVRMVHDHDLYCMRSYKYNPLNRKICTRGASLACVFPCGAVIARNRDGGFPLRWVSYLAKRKELALNRRFSRLVVATQFMKAELLRNGFAPEKIELHAPVPPRNDTAVVSSFSDDNRIIYSGQIIRGKGVDVLLEALARVRLPFQCFILGDGSHRPFCERLSRELGLAGRVHFQGFLPPDQLPRFYQDASLAVVSSVWPEPFGAVGLEAMRYGLPVVAFDAGGIGEWLIDSYNGYLVPWMDRIRYAQRIEVLLRHKPLARELGENGRQMAADRFDFSPYITGLENLFAAVIAERCQEVVL
jgi:glycosyltransferase involved in cell wall biosynthesis